VSDFETQARLSAPSVARNREPIFAVLDPLLAPAARVLELASGSGEHAIFMARKRPDVMWQPSDPAPEARASIAAWIAAEGVANARAPLALDASAAEWPVETVDAMVCINMLHISPWAATEGLMRGAARHLPPGGPLYIYGAFRRAGAITPESNTAFDQDLKRRDPRWGLRLLEEVDACAAGQGLHLAEVVAMPANNLSLVFRKRGA
jgi:cyclopropane fatty-acyl-phospholipid synthase-like methyltransferase